MTNIILQTITVRYWLVSSGTDWYLRWNEIRGVGYWIWTMPIRYRIHNLLWQMSYCNIQNGLLFNIYAFLHPKHFHQKTYWITTINKTVFQIAGPDDVSPFWMFLISNCVLCLEIWIVQMLCTSPFTFRTQDYRLEQGWLSNAYVGIFAVPFMSWARTEHVQFIEPFSLYDNRVSSTLFMQV